MVSDVEIQWSSWVKLQGLLLGGSPVLSWGRPVGVFWGTVVSSVLSLVSGPHETEYHGDVEKLRSLYFQARCEHQEGGCWRMAMPCWEDVVHWRQKAIRSS